MLINSKYTGSYINQQFIVNYKISIKQISLVIPVYNVDSTFNKNKSIKEFAILQLAINNYYKCIDLTVIKLKNIDLFLGHD